MQCICFCVSICFSILFALLYYQSSTWHDKITPVRLLPVARLSRVTKLFCHQRSISEQLVLFMEIHSESTIKQGKFTEFVRAALN